MKSVDRSIARLIATKRIATGIVSIAAGCTGLVWVILRHGNVGNAHMLVAAFLVICFGGGAWSLRDGLRLHHELRK